MKKISLVLFIVIGLLVSFNAFALEVVTIDDSRFEDIKNWTTFSTKNGKTLLYNHKDGYPLIPLMIRLEEDKGYLQFLVKEVPSQEERDEIRKSFKEQYPIEFKNYNVGYMIRLFKLDIRTEMLQLPRTYLYSDTNKFIMALDWKDNKGKYSSLPLKETQWNQIPSIKDSITQAKQEAERSYSDKDKALVKKLQKHGAEALVPINMVEVNPYEYEGHTIAVVVQFKKMISRNTASFYSGYMDLEKYTQVPDEIIVTGIPSGTHFVAPSPVSPRMTLVLKGKGTIEGTNAFGAKINAPYFQWIDIMTGEQKSVFEEQRDISRQETLQNMRNSRQK